MKHMMAITFWLKQNKQKKTSQAFHRTSHMKALKEREVSSAEAKTAISSLKIFTFHKILVIRNHRNWQGNEWL